MTTLDTIRRLSKKICKNCGKSLPIVRFRYSYCNDKCTKEGYRKVWREENYKKKLRQAGL